MLRAIERREVRTNMVVTLVYMWILFILSAMPGGENGNVMRLMSPTVANMLHVPAYGLLALLWVLRLKEHGLTEGRSMWVAFLVASAYGAVTELHQFWVPGRYPSALDVMSNIVGSLLFIGLYWGLGREWRVESVSSRT